MTAHEHQNPEEVLAQLAWVRHLSRRLCADAASADDLSQEVLLAGMARPPRPGIPVRRWLAGIARRKARMASRGEGRRSYHERSAPAPRAEPSTAELLERLEEHRRVADAVAELREPYRTTLLQRYVEDLTPTEIAARTGEPLTSVKTRLSRGLRMLREDLERSSGRPCYALLAPLAFPDGPAAPSPAIPNAAAVGKQGILLGRAEGLLCVIALSALVGYFAWPSIRGGAQGVPRDTDSADAVLAQVTGGLEDAPVLERLEQQGRPLTRSSVPAAEPDAAALAGEEPTGTEEPTVRARVRVLVRTPFGEPVAGALIEQVSGSEPLPALPGSGGAPAQVQELGTSGPDGALTVEVLRPRVRSFLRVRTGGLATLVDGVLPEYTSGEHSTVIVAGPIRRIDGVVTGEGGLPLEDAHVTLVCSEDFSETLGMPVGMQNQHLMSVTADGDGRFAFPSSPESPRVLVKAEAFGHQYRLVSAPERGDASVTIALTPAQQGDTALRGRVVCADGSSSVGAYVALPSTGHSTRVTSENGLFELPINGEDGEERVVHAVLPGFLPATYRKIDGQPWPDDLVLEIGEPALAINGTVVDQAGRPQAGVHVSVADGEAFGVVFEPGSEFGFMERLEDLSATSGAANCVTAKDGSFRVDGLLARTYELLVREDATLRGMRSAPVEAGQSGVRLVLDRTEPSGPVAGRVTDRNGAPVAGLQIRLYRPFGTEGNHNHQPGLVAQPTARSDADGRFQFKDTVVGEVRLRAVGGVRFELLDVPLSGQDDPRDIELVIARNTPFRIEWSEGEPPADARSLRLEPADGETVMMIRQFEDGFSSHGEFPIGGPSTPVHYVREGSYAVVLLRDEVEVDRFPVEIKGEEQLTIAR